jgi:LmbE family N-acetylglucosaminyl deacetylase
MEFKNKRILSFGAHPDDIELGCAGTEYQLIHQHGCEATHVYVTSGEAGSQTISKNELANLREQEAEESAKVLGVQQVKFLRCLDGLTSFDEETRATVINLIREIKPHIIFVHGQCDAFPDHAIVHQLVMSAITGASGPWFQETVGKPWSVDYIFGYEVWHPMSHFQTAVNISASIDVKMKALACFASQVGPTKYHEAFKGLARYRGVMSNAGEYSEVFEILRANACI